MNCNFFQSIKLAGYGINYQNGFSTDISESCIWISPFIKQPGDMWDLRYEHSYFLLYGAKVIEEKVAPKFFMQLPADDNFAVISNWQHHSKG
jgi:hypothetical protein